MQHSLKVLTNFYNKRFGPIVHSAATGNLFSESFSFDMFINLSRHLGYIVMRNFENLHFYNEENHLEPLQLLDVIFKELKQPAFKEMIDRKASLQLAFKQYHSSGQNDSRSEIGRKFDNIFVAYINNQTPENLPSALAASYNLIDDEPLKLPLSVLLSACDELFTTYYNSEIAVVEHAVQTEIERLRSIKK